MDKKILLIDNNPDYLAEMSELLTASGYCVTPAATIADAWEQMRTAFFHLLISDIRMEDDGNTLDESGMAWVREKSLVDLPKILITSFPTFEKAEKVFGRVAAMLAKDEPAKLLTKVGETFANEINLNWDLEILDQSRTDALLEAATYLFPKAPKPAWGAYADEIANLFCGLFPGRERVRIQEILWHRGGRVAFAVHLFTQGRHPESRLMICGPEEMIAKEELALSQYGPELQGFNTAATAETYKTYRLSAMAYRLIDGDLDRLLSLETCFRHKSADRVGTILNDFYDYTLNAWHQSRPSTIMQTPLGEWVGGIFFRDRAGFSKRLRKNLETIQGQIGATGYSWSRMKHEMNFEIGSLNMAAADPFQLFDTALPEIAVPVVNSPGWLSGSNILTDGKRETWLTDFCDAGLAPMVCDFVAIEAALRYDWSYVEPQAALALERALQQEQLTPVAASEPDEELQRTLTAIAIIRQKYLAKKGAPKAYHLGMFFHALIRIVKANPEKGMLPAEARRFGHLILSAAMLANALKGNYTQTPLPEPKAEGISINERRSTIRVHGREYRLSENRFTLFKYLYDLKGQPASRGDLGRTIWGNDYDPDAKAGINLMNTTILRLREQIEEDARNPSIILTTDGGYYLAI